jgi:hypothetical protein
LLAGTAAFTLWAPPALLTLPFAALVFAAGPTRRSEWWTAAVVAGLSLGMIVSPSTGRLDAATRAYVVLLAAAFVALSVYGIGRFLPRAGLAVVLAGAATLLLLWAIWGANGGDVWNALQWEATREASLAGRALLRRLPDTQVMVDEVVRLTAQTVPATLVLQSLAGLGLAWQWHQRLSATPLGLPLGPFRELRFSDHWVWCVVLAVTVWVLPPLADLRSAALNVAVIATALYLLRGAAIVAAVADVFGVSSATLVLGGCLAAALALPLLLLVPGLLTLGLTDTWLEFRRRFAARRTAQRG